MVAHCGVPEVHQDRYAVSLGAAQVACECSQVQVGGIHYLVQKPAFSGTTI